MLKSLRKNTKVIIWTVIVSFALWGGYAVGVQFKKEGRVAGEVFGRDVSFQEFDSFYKASQLFSFSGKKMEDPNLIRAQAWQSLIYSQEAKRQGIDVSDDEVRNEILRILREEKLENPSSEIYRRWLSAVVRENPQEFEKQVREILRIQKLVRQINEPPVSVPTEDEARQRFLREKNELSLELMKFPSLEEATKVSALVKNADDWKKWIQDHNAQVNPTGKIALDAVIGLWGVSEPDALKWLAHEKNTVTEPTRVGNQYALALVVDKTVAEAEKFDKEFKDKYVETLTNQKKYLRFLEWNSKLQERARLKDFLPQSAAPAEPQSPEASGNSAPSPAPAAASGTVGP